MTWDLIRAFTSTKQQRGTLPEDMQQGLDKAMADLLNVGDFVAYERHDPAMLARMTRREGERYIIADVRTGEEVWVGSESLLAYGRPIDEWFREVHADHKDLFLPIYFATSLDDLADGWHSAHAKLGRKDERWRLASELRAGWVPKWGVSIKDEQKHWLSQTTSHKIVSWDKRSAPHRVLLMNTESFELSMGTIRPL